MKFQNSLTVLLKNRLIKIKKQCFQIKLFISLIGKDLFSISTKLKRNENQEGYKNEV